MSNSQSFFVPSYEESPDPWGPLVDWVLSCVPDGIILLEGDLGAGKTSFVQAVARKLGYAGPVLSPTYGLIAAYPEIRLIHGDLYRIESPQELSGLGLEESEGTRIFLEWGAQFQSFLYPCRILIKIECQKDSLGRIALCQIL